MPSSVCVTGHNVLRCLYGRVGPQVAQGDPRKRRDALLIYMISIVNCGRLAVCFPKLQVIISMQIYLPMSYRTCRDPPGSSAGQTIACSAELWILLRIHLARRIARRGAGASSPRPTLSHFPSAYPPSSLLGRTHCRVPSNPTVLYPLLLCIHRCQLLPSSANIAGFSTDILRPGIWGYILLGQSTCAFRHHQFSNAPGWVDRDPTHLLVAVSNPMSIGHPILRNPYLHHPLCRDRRWLGGRRYST